MSRASGRRVPAVPPELQEGPGRVEFVPIIEMPHLAEAAKKSGHTARVLRVHIPDQQVKTPGRRVGQWLMSGEPLKPPAPQYLTEQEIEQMEMDRDGIAAPWEGGFDR
ncbi:hypothetical protein [Nocardia nova]|uniref:hypothetical protein n=1 Tax=Nocardia nova TaxID=37330 RepID=UPI0018937432|nr:hypothetical protein [Nocardia nova]MBF6150281.1 hypothetical protein [Nocardia nova]